MAATEPFEISRRISVPTPITSSNSSEEITGVTESGPPDSAQTKSFGALNKGHPPSLRENTGFNPTRRVATATFLPFHGSVVPNAKNVAFWNRDLVEKIAVEIVDVTIPIMVSTGVVLMGVRSPSVGWNALSAVVAAVGGVTMSHALQAPAERLAARIAPATHLDRISNDAFSKKMIGATHASFWTAGMMWGMIALGNVLHKPETPQLAECGRPNATTQVAGRVGNGPALCVAQPQ